MRKIKVAIATITLLFVCASARSFQALDGDTSAVDQQAVDAVIEAACQKPVVVLGEASHGDGHSDTIKVALVRNLIERCGFNGVLFESSVYEFVPVTRKTDDKVPVSEDLIATAVGGLWKFDTEVQPLFKILAARVNAGKLALGGLDFQTGGFQQTYTNDVMFSELTSSLHRERAVFCNALYHALLYGEAGPGGLTGAARIDALKSCMDDAAVTRDELPPRERVQRELLFRNLNAWLSIAGRPQQDLISARDRMMFQNVEYFLSQLPKPAKIVIWTHNVHAARTTTLLPEYGINDNLGAALSQRFGANVYALAITARAGEYRWSGTVNKPILPPPDDALEAKFGASAATTFVDAAALANAGVCLAGIFRHDYARANWADAFDGVLILNTEHPPHSTRL